MSKTITTEVFTFDELNEKAKEKARDWYREGMQDDYQFAWDSTREDARNIGLELKGYDVDSASFVRNMEGDFIDGAFYTANRIISEHGESCETYKTAQKFLEASTAKNVREEIERYFLESLLRDYATMLQKEFEYRDSNENIDETIIANEYTFTAEGKRFG